MPTFVLSGFTSALFMYNWDAIIYLIQFYYIYSKYDTVINIINNVFLFYILIFYNFILVIC